MSSFSYDRYDRRNTRSRGAFTYWVPLAITVTLAAGGVAAWVWSARSDHEHVSSSSDDEYLSYGEESDHRRRGAQTAEGNRPPSYGMSEGVVRNGESSSRETSGEQNTLYSRVSGALRRSPSPQQVFNSASKSVAAGVAAAGAAVGSALSAIREEDGGSYEDHRRWKEESETKGQSSGETGSKSLSRGANTSTSRSAPQGKRKTVAIVVSADFLPGALDDDDHDEQSQGWKTEEATLLSHLPQVDITKTNLIILIYRPAPRSLSSRRPSSLGSSYAAISSAAPTPGEELQSLEPAPYTPVSASGRDSSHELFDLLDRQAQRMVEKPTNVMTFSNPSGYTHMLKHLAPDTVYVVDSLAGERGSNIEAIKGWVGQVVVVVGGDGTGLGGLIDTEDESERKGKHRRDEPWWQHSDMVGLGKGVEIVDGVRFAEDWERRVGGRD